MTADINNTSLPDTGVDARTITAFDILREWFGGDRYARDYEYLDANFGEQARRVEAYLAAALSARASVAVAVGTLTLSELQRAHVERQKEWCPEQVPDLSFRGNEMAGEVGEACNAIKKLERERHGWRGSRATKEQLAEELADVIHTAVLCAITSGVDIEAATIAKFDATSEKNNLATRIRASLTAPVEETREPVAWQHRILFEDTGKWSEWRWGEATFGIDNRTETRPLYAASTASPSIAGEEAREIPQWFIDQFMGARHFTAASDIDIVARKDAKEYRLEGDWLKQFVPAIAALKLQKA